jgi:hypothetical protein
MYAEESYVLSKGYTNKSIEGLGTIKGADCVIDAITPSADGQYTTVTFGWTGSAGTHITQDMIVYNGRGVKHFQVIVVDDKFHLQVTYTDDTVEDAGEIPLPTVEVGTTQTVEYDEGAEVTQTVTATGIRLNFKIPRGQDGKADPVWNIV